jgi:hypothetical protein
MKKISLFLFTVIFILTACNEDSTGPNNNSNDLVGIWHLKTVNGQEIVNGVFLTYTFANSTLTITSDMDCIIFGKYEIIGNKINATITDLSGSQCGQEIGEQGELEFEVNGNTLTIFENDEDLGSATFVFVREE